LETNTAQLVNSERERLVKRLSEEKRASGEEHAQYQKQLDAPEAELEDADLEEQQAETTEKAKGLLAEQTVTRVILVLFSFHGTIISTIP
jgi:hypothetical protein